MKNRNNAIHDVQEFINTFKVGDEFYVINSWKGKPHSVSVHKIEQIFTYDQHPDSTLYGAWKVRVRNAPDGHSYPDNRFVGDLVNKLHGCFVSQNDALKEFTQRLKDHLHNEIDLWGDNWETYWKV